MVHLLTKIVLLFHSGAFASLKSYTFDTQFLKPYIICITIIPDSICKWEKFAIARIGYILLPQNTIEIGEVIKTRINATKDGLVFDATAILAYIKQYGRNPVTGAPLSVKDLVPLQFHKDTAGEYHCPVTYKHFNDHSHIVANSKTGHVYAYDAIDALCRRTQSWCDLLTNEPFTPSDLITIQNPHNLGSRRIEDFDYIKTGKNIQIPKTVVEGVASEEGALNPTMKETTMIANIINKTKETEEDIKLKHNNLVFNVHKPGSHQKVSQSLVVRTSASQRDHIGSIMKRKKAYHWLMRQRNTNFLQPTASFTSTSVNVSYNAEYRDMTLRESRQEMYKAIKKKKKKAYIRLETSLGPLNFELHCEKVPETCYNFLLHCKSGYYNNTTFHRSIPHFMIQGGDPTGTGTGGISAFGEEEAEFPDEFHPHLVHKGAGVLSMANKGKNTNRSQFFITYSSCQHLDGNHSVFGQVVGGFETLNQMQEVPTDATTDTPKTPINILECIVYANPFDEYAEEAKAKAEQNKEEANRVPLDQLLDPMRDHAKRTRLEVGKYADFKKIISEQAKKVSTQKTDVSRTSVLQSRLHVENKRKSALAFNDW